MKSGLSLPVTMIGITSVFLLQSPSLSVAFTATTSTTTHHAMTIGNNPLTSVWAVQRRQLNTKHWNMQSHNDRPITTGSSMGFDPSNNNKYNLPHMLYMTSGGDDSEEENKGEVVEDSEVSSSTSMSPNEISRVQRFRQLLFPPKKDADGLTTRQKLAKMGLSVLLSYGFVSNMSYSVTISLAWFIFSKRTGMSPLAPGQWKSFLAVYAGFYIFNNVIRPIRVGLSVGVARYFDNIVAFFQNKFKVKKGVAIGITVFFANVVGTLTAMSAGITLASIASGVPIWAK